MNEINDKISKLHLTQVQASKIMKVTQARVSDVNTGRISKFTYDILFLMSDRLTKE
jgi:predicted XRE-type DNA-binding protein